MRGKASTVLEVSGPNEGLNIFINGIFTEHKTPAFIKLSVGDFVSVYSRYTIYTWLVRGHEEYIRFKTETFENGKRLLVNIGNGQELHGLKFERTIKQSEFDELLSSNKRLRVIVASFCKDITSISSLSKHKELWALELEGTQISDLSALANLKELRWLNLRETNISDISPVANLKKLLELNLGGTQILDISPIANLKRLRVLNLGETKIADISPLSNLKNLQELHLAETKISNIQAVANLNELKWFSIKDTHVSDISPLANLKELKWLVLHGAPVSDISPIANLKNLEVLRIGRTKIPQSQVEWLKERLPTCKIIRTVDFYS